MRASILEQDMQMITNENLPWETFLNKKIVISGANGFLPSYMIETLLYLNDTRGLNCKIIGIVRNKEKAIHRFKHHQNRLDLQWIVQDVSQPFTIGEKMDFIVHAASQASPKYYGSDPVGTFSANILGTYHLLEIARVHQIESFFYFSSGEIYGDNKSQLPMQEHVYGFLDPLNLRSCYAESKKMAENMIISYAYQYGLSAKIVRPFHVYGPGVKLDDGRVYSDFLSNIIQHKDILIQGDGLAVRAFCYLADATAGFFTVFLKGKNSEAYNVGNPNCTLSINELAIQLAVLYAERNLKVVNRERPSQPGYIASSTSVISPDISKIMGLGWRPHMSIQAGFKRTVESFYEFD